MPLVLIALFLKDVPRMNQFIGQLQQKMQEFRIGVLRVEDVDEASGKIILTVSEADAAMYQQKKMHQGSTAF